MTVEFRLPELGEGIESAEVIRILVTKGDVVAPDQAVIEIETGKATVEVPCDVAGTVAEVQVAEGDEIKVGQVLLVIEREGVETDAPTPKPAPVETEEPPKAEPAVVEEPDVKAPEEKPPLAVPASPAVRKLARELGVDVETVKGSGPAGRVSVEDVKDHVNRAIRAPVGRSVSAGHDAPPLPDFAQWGAVRRESLKSLRKHTARHMALTWSQVPHVTHCDVADITKLEAIRKRLADRVAKAGAKLTITAILAKVCASALKVWPRMNASLDVEREEVVFKEYVNVGIAVDTEHGLVVPVIRDADRKNMIEIAREIAELAEKARERSLHKDDIAGGTFTITNLGGIGGTHFTPLVNWPEVAILGVGRAYKVPNVEDAGEPKLMLPLSLSYDHRVVDGAEGARFLRWVDDALEEPLLLSVEG